MYEDTLQVLRLIKGYKREEVSQVLNLPENAYGVLELNSEQVTYGQAKILAEFYNMDLEDVCLVKHQQEIKLLRLRRVIPKL
jgi:hypothetical protein